MSDERAVFCLPDLGEGLKEAEIVAWHVGAGDHVVADQPLVSVETDKAVVEVPSPRAGHIAALHGSPGQRIAVGDPLVEFGEAADYRGSLVGDLDRSAGRIKASPAVRRRARQLGVDIETVAGSGPAGAIVTADIERAAGGLEGGSIERLGGVRRAMFDRMTAADRRVVRATLLAEADIEAWTDRVPLMPRLVRAIAVACRVEPRLNAAFDDQALRLELNDSLHLGIAVDTDDGLFAPVLTDAAGRDDAAIGAELERLEAAVRSRTVSPDELHGATMTLSNFGAVGGLYANLVVVPPQVAIVGAGRVHERLVMQDGVPAAHPVLPLSLTIDHRVITGAEACRFMNAMTDDLVKAR